MPGIVIIDYDMGNVGSIRNMFKKIGHDVTISAKSDDILNATGLILPGVGAFDTGMASLAARNIIPLLKKRALDDHIPVLGICLGMQLLTHSSEEGSLPGLSLVPGKTIKFNFTSTENKSLRIPHMGWNTVVVQKKNRLFTGLEAESRFYFVHSYHVACASQDDILTTTPYGFEFCSSLQKNNIYGVQFHPEKSHKFGMQLLSNFYNITQSS